MTAIEQRDVVVVGGGSAAFEAAVAARQHGVERVLLLEKAPEPEFGGNARFSHTGFRFVHAGADEIREFIPNVDEATFRRMHIPPYTHDDYMNDLLRVTRGRINGELAELLVRESNAAVHWMLDTGMEWEPETGVEVDGRYYFSPGMVVHPTGGIEGGLSQLHQWRDIALQLGIEIRYETKVTGLIGSEHGVTGVKVSSSDGEGDVVASATILCSGGFQANAEMRARYLGANADLLKIRGSKHDTGEVLMMALALGAKSTGHWQGAHATPIDATFPDVEVSNKANRYGYNYGITINALGQRFMDEGEATIAYTYAKTGWAVIGQPGGVAYQIFDQKGARLQNQEYYAHATPIEAPSIADLARSIGVEPAVLVHTVEEFNRAVLTDRPFDPTKLDGRSTSGIQPPKSNWADRLDTPPFLAYPVTGGITFTFGGLEVDDHARVMSTADRPIPGLYASGDILGIFFHNYPSCTGQTRNAVFSRLAGEHAASQTSVSTTLIPETVG